MAAWPGRLCVRRCSASPWRRAGRRPAAVPRRHPPPAPHRTSSPSPTATRARGRMASAPSTILVGFFADERLVTLGRDGRPEPRLAERWEMSPDGLTWRFTLRRGLVFQNGQPITSTDARTAIVPDPQAPDSSVPPGLRDLVAVETPTAQEMVIRLKRPNAFLLEGPEPVAGDRRRRLGRRPVPARQADARQGHAASLRRLLPRTIRRRRHQHRGVPVAARGVERDDAGRRRRALRRRAGRVRVRQGIAERAHRVVPAALRHRPDLQHGASAPRPPRRPAGAEPGRSIGRG